MRPRLTVLFITSCVCCGLFACARNLSEDVQSHFIEKGGPNKLFVPGGYITFDEREAERIQKWLLTHCSGWKSASLKDFSPAKTQLLTARSAIEIDADRIVVTFERDPKDLDSTIYIQRPLSEAEQGFWSRILSEIKPPNQSAQPTPTKGG